MELFQIDHSSSKVEEGNSMSLSKVANPAQSSDAFETVECLLYGDFYK